MQPCNEGCTLPRARCKQNNCFGALLIFKMQRPWVLLGDSPCPQMESRSIAVFRACWENVLHLDLASKKEELELLLSQRRCQKSQAAESQWIGCCSGCKLRFSFQTKTWKGARTHADSRETHSRDTQLQQFLLSAVFFFLQRGLE